MITARILSLAGVLHMDFPYFASIDRRQSLRGLGGHIFASTLGFL
jgi:hypothetical protein